MKIYKLFLIILIHTILLSNEIIKIEVGPNGEPVFIKSDTIMNSINRIYNLDYSIQQFGYTFSELNSMITEEIGRQIISELSEINITLTTDFNIKSNFNHNGKWYVSFLQISNNLPIKNSSIGFTIEENGKINTIGGHVFTNIPLETIIPIISIEESELLIKEWLSNNYPSKIYTISSEPDLVILPTYNLIEPQFYLVYQFGVFNNSKLEKTIYVDGNNGTIIKVENSFRNTEEFFSNHGTIDILYKPNYISDYEYYQGFNNQLVSILVDNENIVVSGNTNEEGFYDIIWNGGNEITYYFQNEFPIPLLGTNAQIFNIDLPLVPSNFNVNFEFNPTDNYNYNIQWGNSFTNIYCHISTIKNLFSNNPFNYILEVDPIPV